MARLVLDSYEIEVQPEREKYNAIRRKYQLLAENAAQQFSNAYSSNFSNIDDVHDKCTNIAMAYLLPVTEEAIRDLVAQKIYDIDINEFQNYFSSYFSWNGDFSRIDEKYRAIVSNSEKLDSHRTQRRKGRGMWRGFGFSFGGAFKAEMKATAMNLGTNAVHGVFNLGAKAISVAGDAVKKNALFVDPATKANLTDAVYQLVFNAHNALIAALTDKKTTYTSGKNSVEDAAKAKRLLENIVHGRVPSESIKPVLFEALILNPYGEDFYSYWYKTFGDTNGELDAIETFFGVYVSKKTKRNLVLAHRSSLDLSTPEACEKSVVALEAYALSIGYQEFPSQKGEIMALAKKLDRGRRTVEGREYTTLDAANAEWERIRLQTLRQDNTLTSSGMDIVKIVGGLICLLIAIAMLMDSSKKNILWMAIPFAISVVAIREVRSVRGMKFARGIGYFLAAIGTFSAAIGIGVVKFSNGTFDGSLLLAIFALIGIGWGIHELMRVRYQEAGHDKPKSYFKQSLVIGGVIGGVLFAGIATYRTSMGLTMDSAAPAIASVQPPTIVPPPPPPPPPAPAASTVALTPPGATIAITELYGIVPPTAEKVALPSGEEVVVWYSATITTDSGPRFLVMVARTNPNAMSRADGAKIDIVSYREEAGQWKVDAKAKESFGVGTQGSAPNLNLAKIENHSLKQGLTGIFLPDGSSGQGYGNDYLNVLAVGNGAIEYLGQIETGGENSGNCDTNVKDGFGACYTWTGHVQVEPSRNGHPGNILVNKTGTESIDSKITLAQQTRYIWENGKGYTISKE